VASFNDNKHVHVYKVKVNCFYSLGKCKADADKRVIKIASLKSAAYKIMPCDLCLTIHGI
jgi:hypothetical protein